MITIVNQVSSAWFENKLLRKSLHNHNHTVGLYSVWKVKGTIKEDLVTLLLTTPTRSTINSRIVWLITILCKSPMPSTCLMNLIVWFPWELPLYMTLDSKVACEQALCLGKKIASSPLDQRPVHRLTAKWPCLPHLWRVLRDAKHLAPSKWCSVPQYLHRPNRFCFPDLLRRLNFPLLLPLIPFLFSFLSFPGASLNPAENVWCFSRSSFWLLVRSLGMYGKRPVLQTPEIAK